MQKSGVNNKMSLPNHIQFDTVSPATKLLEKRRKMYEVHEAFEQQKEEFKRQEAIFKTQEEAIRERDLGIQEQLIRFCKFLQENEAKKNRADRRAFDEERIRDTKQKEIDELVVKCKELLRQQQKLERKVTALMKYEDYLQSVIKSNADQYEDPTAIINRYKTLVKSNDHLVRDHNNLEQEFEKLKVECSTFEKDKNHEILQLNNEIKDLQKILEEKQKERNDLQATVEDSTKDASSKNLNLGRIIFAIDNLYSKCQQVEILKIRAEIDQGNRNEKDHKNKGDKKDQKKQDEAEKEDENEDYSKRSEQAISKIKAISVYMKDFNKIIFNCNAKIAEMNKKN